MNFQIVDCKILWVCPIEFANLKKEAISPPSLAEKPWICHWLRVYQEAGFVCIDKLNSSFIQVPFFQILPPTETFLHTSMEVLYGTRHSQFVEFSN